MHFLTHFPIQMEKFGPLRHHHCFRFKAKKGLILNIREKILQVQFFTKLNFN
jgi:hypothetical protein